MQMSHYNMLTAPIKQHVNGSNQTDCSKYWWLGFFFLTRILFLGLDENNAVAKMSYTYKYLMSLVAGLWIVDFKCK